MLSIPGTIPIKIFPFFWFLAIVIGWLSSGTVLGTAIWTVVIVVSVLIHEYGHALTALAFGQRAQIQLVALGGLTQRRGPKLRLWQEFVVVMNGPVAGLILFAAAYALDQALQDQPLTPFTYAVKITMYANLFWTVVNLLPVLPLDGGRLLSIILEGIFGLRGVKIALFIGLVLSVAVGVLFFVLQNFLAGALFFMITFDNYRAWQASMAMTDEDQDVSLQQMLAEAQKATQRGDYAEAEHKLVKLLEMTKSGVIYLNATENLAAVYHLLGRYKDAYQLLLPLKSKLNQDALRLLHQLAFQNGEFHEAIELGDRSYKLHPNYNTALLNALSHSVLGDTSPAIGWLECAIRDGMPDSAGVLEKREFDSIRSSPRFQDLLKQSGK